MNGYSVAYRKEQRRGKRAVLVRLVKVVRNE